MLDIFRHRYQTDVLLFFTKMRTQESNQQCKLYEVGDETYWLG